MHDALGLAAGQQPAAGGQFLFTEMGTTTVHLALPVPGYQVRLLPALAAFCTCALDGLYLRPRAARPSACLVFIFTSR